MYTQLLFKKYLKEYFQKRLKINVTKIIMDKLLNTRVTNVTINYKHRTES
jgi:hypothetical protein